MLAARLAEGEEREREEEEPAETHAMNLGEGLVVI
jgi:hypothetical protein